MSNNASSFSLIRERNTIVVSQTRPRASLPSAVTGLTRPGGSNSGGGLSQRSYLRHTAHHIIHSQRSSHYAYRTLLNMPVGGIHDPPGKKLILPQARLSRETVFSWSHERRSSSPHTHLKSNWIRMLLKKTKLAKLLSELTLKHRLPSYKCWLSSQPKGTMFQFTLNDTLV